MIPPPSEAETDSGSQVVLLKKKGWWARRTALEKILLSVLGVAGMSMALTAVIVVRPEAKADRMKRDELSAKNMQEDVCLTPECAVAAASIIQSMDITVDPCEDFYRFSCGGWMDSNVFPDGKSRWGSFDVLMDKVDNDLKTIVTSEDPTESSAVTSMRAMFSACMDTEGIEAAGLTSLLNQFGAMGTYGGWPMIQDSWTEEKFDLFDAVGSGRRYLDQNWLLSVWVWLDNFNPEQNVIYIDQPRELGLPLSMYLDTESYADYIAAYKTFMVESAKILVREIGSAVSEEILMLKADEVFEFESQLAMVMTPYTERKNKTAMYNPMLISELKENYPNFDWGAYFTAVFADTDVTVGDDERVIVVQPDYFEATQSMEPSMELLANYVYWRSIMVLDGDLTEELRHIAFNFRSVMTGVNTAPPRWQTCLSNIVIQPPDIESVGFWATLRPSWGFAAAHEYILENFDEGSKAQADSMVNDLRSVFKELVEETKWMDSESKVKAEEKADLMLQQIGYPDWLVEVEKVDAFYWDTPASIAEDHLGNVLGMKRWGAKQDLVTLRMETERDTWLMHPAIVNAWYTLNRNTITIPASILQPPFFHGGWPRYLNYGAIGMAIGHEITHGFDDEGRQCDGTGSLNPWWSPETIEAFSVQAQCFIDQYSNYTVPELEDILGEDAHLNGKNTQSENIADNGGIHEAFRAYIRSIESHGGEPPLPGLTQFTSEQMFFISFAQVWCEIDTPEELLGQILDDTHSPGNFRVIGSVGNSEEFQREFGCSADSSMNRVDKCKLW